MKYLYLFLLCIILTAPLNAQETQLSLKSCVEKTLLTHPLLIESANSMKIANLRIYQSEAAYKPKLSISASASESGNFKGNPSIFSASNSLSLSQFIADFGSTSNRVNSVRENSVVAACNFKSRENDIVYTVKEAYFRYLEALEKSKLQKELLEISQRHAAQSHSYYKNGLSSKIEVSTSDLQVSESKYNLSLAENSLKNAKLRLYYAMGYDAPQDFEFDDSCMIPELNVGEEALISAAQQYNPELQKNLSLQKIAQYNLAAAKAAYNPFISSHLSVGNSYSDRGSSTTWGGGVSMQLPILDGGSRKYAIEESQLNLDSVVATNRRTTQSVLLNVRTAYRDVVDFRNQVTLLQESASQAGEKFRLAESRYNEGVGSNLEYLDARASFLQTGNSLISASFRYLIAVAELEKAVGADISSFFTNGTGVIFL